MVTSSIPVFLLCVARPAWLRSLSAAFLLLMGAATAWPQRLVVASQLNNPPYEYVDAAGRPAGYVNDLIRAVAEVEGLDLEIRSLAWNDLRTAFDHGEVQAVTGMVFSEERAKVMDFTIPHSYVPYVLIIRKGDSRIRSEQDLLGRKVLVLGKSIMSEHLDSMGIPYQATTTHEESILQLPSGQADAAIVPKYPYLFFIQARGIQNLQAVPSEVYPTKRCFAVHKGDAKLLAKLNEGLFLIQQSGRMDEIYGRHLGALEADEVPFSAVLKRSLKVVVPVSLGLGLLAALVWSLTLKRQVDRRTAHLQAALAEVRQLSGLIPICARCKKIRDDDGYWQGVEGYISEHSEARFTHGVCPDCMQSMYPEYDQEIRPMDEPRNGSGT